MIADDVADYLAQKLFYKRGVNLFVNKYDNIKTECVIVYDTGSVNVDPYNGLDTFTVQVMVISKKHATAKEKALNIYDTLNAKQGIDINDKTFNYTVASQTPYMLGKEKSVWKVVANYQIMTCL